jgi:hypothetical protein
VISLAFSLVTTNVEEELTFCLKTWNRDFYFKAETKEEYDEWVKILQRAVDEAKAHKMTLKKKDSPDGVLSVLAAFVNVRSGGQQGAHLAEVLSIVLTPDLVFKLPEIKPEQAYIPYIFSFLLYSYSFN